MVIRVLAWLAVIFGAVITAESVFVAHRPNFVWILIFILGLAFFLKNGFIQRKQSPPGSNTAANQPRGDARQGLRGWATISPALRR